MDEDGSWRLAPAYDITYIIDNGGFLPTEDHCLYIRAIVIKERLPSEKGKSEELIGA